MLSWQYKLSIIVIILYSGYLLLYTLHYRSYYFIKGADISEIEFVRYMINMILIYSLIGGIGFYHVFNYISNKIIDKKGYVIYGLISILTIALCGISYYYTNNLRKIYYEEEYTTRTLPTINTLRYIDNPNSVIITHNRYYFRYMGLKISI